MLAIADHTVLELESKEPLQRKVAPLSPAASSKLSQGSGGAITHDCKWVVVRTAYSSPVKTPGKAQTSPGGHSQENAALEAAANE